MAPKRGSVKPKGKPRRRLYSLLPKPTGLSPQARKARSDAGAALHHALLSFYGLCKLSAKDFSICMYFCAMAGVPGGDYGWPFIHSGFTASRVLPGMAPGR